MIYCSYCTEPIEREFVEHYNGLPIHLSCKIALMVNDGCKYKDTIDMLIKIGYSKSDAKYLLKKEYNWEDK